MRKLQAKTKLILALSFILVSSFLVTSIINYRVSREAIRREIMTSSLPLTSENIYSQIHTDLLKPINVSSLMATDTFLRDWVINGEKDTNKIVNYLKTIQARYGYFSSFFVSAITANYYYSEGILKQIAPEDSHDDWYFGFIGSGKNYELDVDTNEAKDNRLTIFINFRLETKDGELLGVTGVGLEMDRISKLLKHYQRSYDRRIYLVDPKGRIQAHTDQSLVNNHVRVDWGDLAASPKDILVPQPSASQYQLDRDGRHILLSIRYIPEFDWYLVVEHNETASLRTVRSNMTRTLGIGFGVSLVIIFLTILTLNNYQGMLERMASTDELTGVGNRREFDRKFHLATSRKARHDIDYSLILFDIDGLKMVNDQLGHLEGDKVIIAVSQIISSNVRALDFVARWGGDEFIVLVEGDAARAGTVAERIRTAVQGEQLPQQTSKSAQVTKISISCGVSQYTVGDTLDALTSRADKAMYAAKNQGKNAVVTA